MRPAIRPLARPLARPVLSAAQRAYNHAVRNEQPYAEPPIREGVPGVPAAVPDIPALADVPRRAALRTAAPIGVHAGVDFIAFATVSLIPLLKTKLALEPWQIALMLGLNPLCSGIVQPMVAYLSDRHDHRWLGTAGIVMAGVCIGGVGMAESYWQLVTLFLLGQIGVGAFHPPAAAATGHLAGPRFRGTLLGVFFLMGMVGGMAGNVLTPRLIGLAAGGTSEAQIDAGLRWMLLLAPLSVLLAIAIGRAIHRLPHRPATAHADHAALPPAEQRRRWRAVGLLYFCNVIRFTVNNALIYLFSAWAAVVAASRAEAGATEQRVSVDASVFNGLVQAAQQFGAGAGGIVLGAIVGSRIGARFEKHLYVLVPMAGAAAAMLFPRIQQLDEAAGPAAANAAAIAASALAGLGFGGLIPLSMSTAQRLLPHRAMLATGMMLGGAWAFAFTGPIIAERIHTASWGGLATGFVAAGAALALAGVLAMLLDRELLAESANR